ncbi:hypothetical protein DL95DRAFT_413344 [Leptodontidium sp. 2 PMI_412]|nr:hypothetical protein DL95DRAFT_413344 [Leptodontidium sp. 2 PMI_412]
MSQHEVSTGMSEPESSAPSESKPAQTLEECIAEIPEHPSIVASNRDLTITLDFASGELALPDWQVASPPSLQLMSVECQNDIVRRVADLVDQLDGVEKITVTLQSPESNWTQIQCLGSFYRMSFKGWKGFIKEGDSRSKKIVYGDDWDKRLRGLFRTVSISR